MQQPRLIVPALGAIYRALTPVTEPLIRVVAGGSLAIHGYPILLAIRRSKIFSKYWFR